MTVHDDADEPLSAEEQAALRGARRDWPPPGELEARVMQAIARDRAAPPFRSRRTVVAGLAAAAVFVAGLWLGVSWPRPAPASAVTGSKFMLLLYEDSSYEVAADQPARVREYSGWAQEIAKTGSLVSGDELDNAGILMTKTSAPSLLTPDQSADQPRGYFVIIARDEVEATRVAATCPHLKYGGRIVVRRILT